MQLACYLVPPSWTRLASQRFEWDWGFSGKMRRLSSRPVASPKTRGSVLYCALLYSTLRFSPLLSSTLSFTLLSPAQLSSALLYLVIHPIVSSPFVRFAGQSLSSETNIVCSGIQCDETHPTCNNCKKSKRECLGYDPIFKQQQTPSNLQPSPTGEVSPSASTTSTSTVPSSTPAPYTTHPTPILTPSDPPSSTRDQHDDGSIIKYEHIDPERPAANIDPALHKAGSDFAVSVTAIPSADAIAQQPGEATHLRGGGSHSIYSSSPPTQHVFTILPLSDSPAHGMRNCLLDIPSKDHEGR